MPIPPRSRLAHLTRAGAALALVVTAAACGGGDADTDDATADAVLEDVEDAAESAEDMVEDGGLEEAAESAEDVLEDAGIDPDAPGSADLSFMGESYQLTAAESFGCFLTEDGGSQGAVDFDGTTDDGVEFSVSWAGDSPDAATASLTTADGVEWTSPFDDGAFDVTVSGTSATVAGGLVSLVDGEAADFSVDVSCG